MTHEAGHVAGVAEVGEVRARWVGHRMEGDAVVHADAALSLADADALARRVEDAMRAEVRNLDRVTVRVHAA